MSNLDLSICEPGHPGGFLLPIFGQDENKWPRGLRVVLYMLGLGYCFMGVAVVADIFMSAIECITSKKTRKLDPSSGRYVTVHVWNPTVANLTLMALGSSAPEILLSVIELFGNSMYSGNLGPSTIVGSAAFNLFCIIAVCVVSIPDGEIRQIKEMPVYIVTASFSIFAYLWLLFILLGPSKNVVEPWEGIVTFLFFPGLVILAFVADRGYLSSSWKAPGMGRGIVLSAEMSKEELAALDAQIRREYGKDLSPDQVSKIARIEYGQGQSRAQYRVAATRAMTGAKRVKVTESLQNLARTFSGPVGEKVTQKVRTKQRQSCSDDLHKVIPIKDEEEEAPEADVAVTYIEFLVPKYAVLENAGSVKTIVKRTGNESATATVNYKTCDGTANAESDYTPVEGSLTFRPGETDKVIEVKIIDDIAFEEDEEFYIDLFCPNVDAPKSCAVLGANSRATIVIIDDDLPGVISFPEDNIKVPEQVEDSIVDLVVERKHGCTGKVTCRYKTESSSALSGQDFDGLDGVLTFNNGETQAKIQINIKARGRYERTENFRLILTAASGGAKFDPESDGGADSCILTIFIESEQAGKDRVDRLMSALAVNWDKAKVGHANWCEQIRDAVCVNGGDDDDDDDVEEGSCDEGSSGPSVKDWVMHIVFVPWKVLFAILVPPTDYCGGWVCFGCSLLMIGAVTALINDLASLLGCVMTMPDYITAITFVALGTSLPDTFASMTAAMQDPYADASVGNVTGSNSVNVFLGLGLPWMIGAIYWRSKGADDKWLRRYENEPGIDADFKDGAFVVMAGTLAFSVIVFSICACVAIMVLLIRRKLFKGELGGSRISKWVSAAFLVSLWIIYVSLSSWKAMSEVS